MRSRHAFIPTRKENPADADMPSHRLLIRAGYMEQVAAGIYNLLPLGWRSVRKIMQIVREELDRAGAQEMLMPMVQPAELWERSGRWQKYGPELLRFRDRKDQPYCLGPTHEEVITDLVSRHVRSYRDMPLNLYQMQAKFRDELRPRAGLLRGREFLMKDAYSFDADAEVAAHSYAAMRDAYHRIFTRCGLDFRMVEADTGNIGGSASHEFQVLAQTGEDRIVACGDYAANVEQAALPRDTTPDPVSPVDDVLAEILTPNKRTIEDVSTFLQVSPAQLIKTLIYVVDDAPVAILIRGDHEANEIKIRALLDASEVVLADDTVVQAVTQAPVGFAGPLGLSIPVYADYAVERVHDGVVGANKADTHWVHVEPLRDLTIEAFADLRMAAAGDPCSTCEGGVLETFRGIEVGHIFLLGTRYSEPMGATYLDQDGVEKPIVMGCYGIGITRILAAAVEQHHDDDGIIWPMSLAPYQVAILPLQMQLDAVVEAAETVYRQCREAGIEALLDDRDLRAGAKFKDADLIGLPLRVVIGSRGLKRGVVEIKRRTSRDAEEVALADVGARLTTIIEASLEHA